MNSAERRESVERFAEMKENIGENPAKLLDRNLTEHGSSHTDNTVQRLVIARIRGIDKLRTVAAWLTVEHKIERGPREPIVNALEDRRDYLESNGERPDLRTASIDERPARYEPSNRQVPPKEAFIVEKNAKGQTVDRTPYHKKRGKSASAKIQKRRSSAEVATDGGESGE